ncbi:MAG: NCS2 family permease [Christensenellaceae bacterium]|nr:NCS2 family permease [Christensenellaceae bacterium]
MFEKMFKLKENGTNVRTEVIAGITTFFAMAYIIFVNPSILGEAFGEGYGTALMVATCIAAALGTLLTAFIANVPFAQAPGMGLNAFFTYTVCFGMGYTAQQALAIVLISGVLFLIITVSPLRKAIIASIPAPLKAAIGGGIGLFIALVGLCNADLVVASNTFDVNAAGISLAGIPDLGAFNAGTILVIIGLILTAVLMAWKVKGALFIGIIATTIIGIPMGVTVIPETFTLSGIGDISKTFLALDFNLMTAGLLPLITAIVTFLICDMFDTVGTLIGTAGNAGMLDENGNLPRGDRALIADGIATCTGALLGTSTVTTFVESSTGISEGGRTGLTSLVTGLLFLVAILLAPVAGIIPTQATAPALIIVGVLMMKAVKNIDWNDIEVAIPCFLTIAGMPFFYSIADGIGFGFITYTIIKMFRGKFKEVPVLMYILSALFIAMYVLSNI